MKKQGGEKVERRVANIKHRFLKKKFFKVKPVELVKSCFFLNIERLLPSVAWCSFADLILFYLIPVMFCVNHQLRSSSRKTAGKQQEEDQNECLDEVETLMTDLTSFFTAVKEI